MTTSSSGVQPFMPRPEDLETFYVAFLYPGPTYRDSQSDPRASQDVLRAHVSYVWHSQHGDGPAIAGGPLLSGQVDAGAAKGMTVFRARSLLEAQHLAAADPAVVTGHFRVEVIPWLVAPGRFPAERPKGK